MLPFKLVKILCIAFINVQLVVDVGQKAALQPIAILMQRIVPVGSLHQTILDPPTHSWHIHIMRVRELMPV